MAMEGLRILGYQSLIARIDGEDADRKKVAHVAACYTRSGVRGYVNWQYAKEWPASEPWQKLILTVNPCDTWLATRVSWCDMQGNRIVGLS